MKYKVGDIITNGEEILKVTNIFYELYYEKDGEENFYDSWTEERIDRYRYHLKDEPNTITLNGKEYDLVERKK